MTESTAASPFMGEDEKVKVLFLSNNSVGMYQFRREVIEAAGKKGETYLCTPKGVNVDYWKTIGCKYVPCAFDAHGTDPVKDLRLLMFYRKLIREIRPDIVFTYTIKPNIYGGMACAMTGTPYVANITGIGSALESKGVLRTVSLALYRMGLRKAQKVFFQNSANEQVFVDHRLVHGPHELIPGSGVNLQQFSLSPYPKGDTVDFAYIGRLMKEKGIEQYFDAAAAIRAKHPETRFHIYGVCEKEYQEKLKKLQEDGTVIYHGFAGRMAEVYPTIACTVHPTYYPEGISNILLESAATGRPVITTNRPGSREVVDEGVNGFFVRERDSADLIRVLEDFLKLSPEEREKMGKAGREKVEKSFSREIVIEKYLREMDAACQR